ncbi:MAG: DUF5818 domain-containing protein [Candidatus Sulfotelmatobacter sp.]|jgi:hypothetical protein
MKKQVQFLWFLSALALFLSVGISLSAQDGTQPTQTPDTQSQPAQSPAPEAQPTPTQEAQPSQTPDASGQTPSGSQAPPPQAANAQSFSGTVVKSGDKYVLKDEASGNTYDLDHQDEVQKFEGKRVKVHGTLDASGKMIHLQ